MPSPSDVEYAFYEKFFFARGLEPYPAQEKAFDAIFAGRSVLVTVPTGTGKTLMAKAGIHKALAHGQTAVYTTPLRALTEEKFRELCEDFGEDKVGFATGDYKVRPDAPIQVVVAEILWNRIYGDRVHKPADLVVMDEGHYFNDPERGYVWEQSIIGLDPRTQLVILSATIGDAQQFVNWVYSCRKDEMLLVEGGERRVPLYHEYREEYLIDTIKALHRSGDTPAIVFKFSRDGCFETARLIKSCPRFTSDEERAKILEACKATLMPRGLGGELQSLLQHGIGVHHAGILPRYKALVERLVLERLVKFVVSTETISAGINLPARRVVFPELRKFIQGKPRLLTSAEYHQMAGRAGRPQFDSEGIAVTLAPEAVVQEIRKEMKDAAKGRSTVSSGIDENVVRKKAYARAKADAVKDQDVTWDAAAHAALVAGKPAPLKSQTKVTAEQILAIGLPDLATEQLPGEAETESSPFPTGLPRPAGETKVAPFPTGLPRPAGETKVAPFPTGLPRPAGETKVADEIADSMPVAYGKIDIKVVIDHLLLPEREKWQAHKRLAQVTANLRAMGVVDEHGVQVRGKIVNQLRGIDGLFVFFALTAKDFVYLDCRELVEFLVEHDVVQRILDRKIEDAKREWIRNRLRERRRDEPQVSWEDVEAEYEREHPRELGPVEQLHAEFVAKLPHPELHGGKKQKKIWARMEDEQLSFHDFVEKENLAAEEGNLFSYLARVMKFAKMLAAATGMPEFATLEGNVRRELATIDERVLEEA